MNQRIKNLRQKSLEAINKISTERAELITEFYKSEITGNNSVPVQRALAFKYILENKKIWIGEGELIVGERGPQPKATPTYPEVCLHSIQDLEILDSRPKVFFRSDEKNKDIYQKKIIPFWEGKTQRDKIFSSMSPEWLNAYEAGVFTEFQEQRAPGHTVLGDKIYKKGFRDLIDEINNKLSRLNDDGTEKQEQLKAMKIAAEAMIAYARRNAMVLSFLAMGMEDSERKTEMLEMAAVCNNVPANAPRNFHEALQYYWFAHLGVITELNPWDSFNPGRLDQHLYPFYKKEIEDGSLTKERAKELLMAFWVKFNNHPSPPKIGVTAKESNTYTDFALINVGGLKADGSNAVNELSYIILDVVEEMRILQPSSMVQLSRENPDEFIKRALKIVKTGFGQPSIFNTDAIVPELMRQGKTLEDARNGGASGCVESGAFGKEAYWLSGYFNLAKILEVTLNNGTDPQTGKKIGPETGDPESFENFDELMSAYEEQLKYFAGIKIRGNQKIEKLWGENVPAPFLSLLIDDCIENAMDYNKGGAKYNTTYIQGVGMGSITDMLTALKYHVFESDKFDMSTILFAMKSNFEGFDELRKELIFNTPKYGNDDDYADDQAVKVFDIFFNAIDGKPNSRGGKTHIMMLPTTSHVYFGSKIGAMPDGRKARLPLSEGISPFQGADTKGPTAAVRSAVKFDHLKTGGTLLNQKFTPQILDSEKGLESLKNLIRGYFKMNGHHIQFNVVTADTLKDAKEHPEKYRDLIVRVAGYSDYFNDLGEELQDEIIRRTEHEGF